MHDSYLGIQDSGFSIQYSYLGSTLTLNPKPKPTP